jgi:hypothetical protein
MIEDCFSKWYEYTFPDLNPELDDFYHELRKAYYAGWMRHREIDEALTEISQLGQDMEEY